jgi:ADP-ribose pyrophosphatase YjhB (NUDIX family)
MSVTPPSPPFQLIVPEGDDRARHVCGDCGFIHYQNPKIVVGSVVAQDVGGVVTQDSQILLCRRAIEPRRGFWTLPAGFLEEAESVEDGARREAREEAMAEIVIDGVLAIYSIPRISQVQIMFRARLLQPTFAPGPESLETALFGWTDIPWTELAFPSVVWALHHHRAFLAGAQAPFTNPS